MVDQPTQFRIEGVNRSKDELYGYATSLTREKQDYWGDDKSYLFDPTTERYERVDNMTLARWYPTLVGLKDGRVLAVSGLDDFGRMIQGDNEIYDPTTKKWEAQPQLQRTFPTYPAAVPDAEREPLLHRQQRGLRVGHGRPRTRASGT